MNINKLKEIVENAPYQNLGEYLFINKNSEYILFYEDDFYIWNDEWVKIKYEHGYYELTNMRSLEDVRTIIELYQCVVDVESSYGYDTGKSGLSEEQEKLMKSLNKEWWKDE